MTKEKMRQIKRNAFFELASGMEDQAYFIRIQEDQQRKKELTYNFATRCGEWVGRLQRRVDSGIINEIEKEVFFNRTIELARQLGINVTDDAYGKGIRFFMVLDISSIKIN